MKLFLSPVFIFRFRNRILAFNLSVSPCARARAFEIIVRPILCRSFGAATYHLNSSREGEMIRMSAVQTYATEPGLTIHTI